MRLRRECGENKKQHYHQCHPVSSALAAARTATQESAFTATVNAAKIRQIDNGAHQHRLFETMLCLLRGASSWCIQMSMIRHVIDGLILM